MILKLIKNIYNLVINSSDYTNLSEYKHYTPSSYQETDDKIVELRNTKS